MAQLYGGQKDGFGLRDIADLWLFPASDSLVQDSDGFKEASATYDGTSVAIKIGNTTVTADSAAYVFDSLKVSSIEISSQEVAAKGGKGNPDLLTWSYGKELTLNFEDALLSEQSMALIYGGTAETGRVTVDANTFPGQFYAIGQTIVETMAGDKKAFLFVLPRVKFQAQGTLSMNAEGDPSTLSMNGKALNVAKYGDKTNVLMDLQLISKT